MEPILGREREWQLLSAFVNDDPATLTACVVVHGLKSLGKTHVVDRYVATLSAVVVTVRCDVCLTVKFVLQKIIQALEPEKLALVENFASFVPQLRRAAAGRPVVIVLDRLDQCMENPRACTAAFAKLKETVPNVTVVMVVQLPPEEVALMAQVVPIYFQTYSEQEVIRILQQNPMGNSNRAFYVQLVEYAVSYYYLFTGSDLRQLHSILSRLWLQIPDPESITDVRKWIRANQQLFQSDSLLKNNSVIEFATLAEERPNDTNSNVKDLPLYSKCILVALYLALYIEPKFDLLYFSSENVKKSKKEAKLAREKREPRVLVGNFFDLERMLAILLVKFRTYLAGEREQVVEIANLYDDLEARDREKQLEVANFSLAANSDLNNQLATLHSLGLMLKSANADILGAKVRWKVNIDWETAVEISNEVGFEIVQYFA